MKFDVFWYGICYKYGGWSEFLGWVCYYFGSFGFEVFWFVGGIFGFLVVRSFNWSLWLGGYVIDKENNNII